MLPPPRLPFDTASDLRSLDVALKGLIRASELCDFTKCEMEPVSIKRPNRRYRRAEISLSGGEGKIGVMETRNMVSMARDRIQAVMKHIDAENRCQYDVRGNPNEWIHRTRQLQKLSSELCYVEEQHLSSTYDWDALHYHLREVSYKTTTRVASAIGKASCTCCTDRHRQRF